jgi:type II secretory pathway component PulJ
MQLAKELEVVVGTLEADLRSIARRMKDERNQLHSELARIAEPVHESVRHLEAAAAINREAAERLRRTADAVLPPILAIE